jgi:cytochrome c oxidase assembly protein subunit 15
MLPEDGVNPRSKLARYAWGVTGWNVLTILWGAYVRATGAGAGCGSHWPLCNGVVLPRAPELETLVEFSHRLTSGVALLLILGLVWAGRRLSARASLVRRAAWASLALVVLEALIGAGLVLFGWVAEDSSSARAWAVALHLVNTLLLLAALTVTAYAADRPDETHLRWSNRWKLAFGLGLAAVAALGATGAVTALGDTLFPARSLAEGLSADVAAESHVLVRLRLVHPVLAILAGGYVLALAGAARSTGKPAATRWAWALTSVVLVQWAAGALNVLLLAPVGLQLLHLLLADLVWIILTLLMLVVGEAEAASPRAVRASAL